MTLVQTFWRDISPLFCSEWQITPPLSELWKILPLGSRDLSWNLVHSAMPCCLKILQVKARTPGLWNFLWTSRFDIVLTPHQFPLFLCSLGVNRSNSKFQISSDVFLLLPDWENTKASFAAAAGAGVSRLFSGYVRCCPPQWLEEVVSVHPLCHCSMLWISSTQLSTKRFDQAVNWHKNFCNRKDSGCSDCFWLKSARGICLGWLIVFGLGLRGHPYRSAFLCFGCSNPTDAV